MKTYAAGELLSPADINNLVKARAGRGVLYGAEVSNVLSTGAPAPSVAGGIWHSEKYGTRSVPPTTSSFGKTTSTYPRYFLTYADASAEASGIEVGTAQESPDLPDLTTAEDLGIAEIYRPGTDDYRKALGFKDCRGMLDLDMCSMFRDDFCCLSTKRWGTTVNGSASHTLLNDTSVRASTGGTVYSAASLFSSGTFNAEALWFRARFQSSVDNPGSTHTHHIGLSAITTGVPFVGNARCVALKVGGNRECYLVTADGSNLTSTELSLLIMASTWYTLDIMLYKTATSAWRADLYIDGVNYASHTTTMPGLNPLRVASKTYNTSSDDATTTIDYAQVIARRP